MKLYLLSVAVALGALSVVPAVAAGTLDGLYTAEQAARGRTAYIENCIRCHGYDLMGDGKFVPGIGKHEFAQYWWDRSVGDLYFWISTKMPDNTPGSLSPSAYADVLAYVLQQNGYPSGPVEIVPDVDQLLDVSIEPINAPQR